MKWRCRTLLQDYFANCENQIAKGSLNFLDKNMDNRREFSFALQTVCDVVSSFSRQTRGLQTRQTLKHLRIEGEGSGVGFEKFLRGSFSIQSLEFSLF